MTRERRDWGVILARGDSARMGRPKGLCRLPGDAASFLASICGLYARAGLPVAVVTRPDLGSLYRAETTGIDVDADRACRKLSGNSRVARCSAVRLPPDALLVEIEERRPVARLLAMSPAGGPSAHMSPRAGVSAGRPRE